MTNDSKGKVVSLTGQTIAGNPNQNIIDALEEALVAARAGRIDGFLMGYASQTNPIIATFLNWSDGCFGEAATLLLRLNARMQNQNGGYE